MRRRRRTPGFPASRLLLAASLLVALLTSGSALSGANFSAASANRQTQVSSAADWVPPVVALADPGAAIRGSVTLTTSASDAYGTGVVSVKVQRALAGTETWTDICTVATAPYSCGLDTTRLANDYYDFRAVATDGAGFTTTSAAIEVQVDNREPSVTMVDPGATLSGVVTLSAEASDEDSGVASVTIQRSPAGKNSWSEICTIAALPYSCRFDTRTVAEGSYDFRAVATDIAGNSKVSSIVGGRKIDNTVNSISLEDPGAYLHGKVGLTANASSSAGVASVTIQRSPAGKNSWSEICRVTTSPYSCVFDTATVADGSYDLRAQMTTAVGAQYTSATVAARQVDNTAIRGTDVQTANRSGGSAGKIEAGDSISLYYSELMSPASIVAGWSGSAATPIYMRLRDGNLVGTGSSGDTVSFSTDSSGAKPIALGSVNLHGGFVKSNKTVAFQATLAASTRAVAGGTASTLTVTVGSIVSGSGSLQTSTALAQMVWTPSSLATDLAGNPCSTSPVTETGVSDRDF